MPRKKQQKHLEHILFPQHGGEVICRRMSVPPCGHPLAIGLPDLVDVLIFPFRKKPRSINDLLPKRSPGLTAQSQAK